MALWLRLGSFSVGLLLLSFLLKAICPVSQGCFTGPMVKLFFAPLFFMESGFSIDLTVGLEIVFLIVFWFVIGGIVGLAIDELKKGDQNA